jgi:hypothetical protein
VSESFSIGEIVIFVPDFHGEPSLNKYAGEVEVVEYDDWMKMYGVEGT